MNSVHLAIMSGPSIRQINSTHVPLTTTSTLASSSSARSNFYNQHQSSSHLNSPSTSKPPKLIPPKPKLPCYLADTSFAELFHSMNAETLAPNGAYGDKDPSELVALPTSWSNDDKCVHLDLSADKLSVNYTVGSGKTDSDAAAIRANHPMPSQCGLFYFEVEIISKGRDGYIGIGFCGKSVNLARLPGWEPCSWGYHGDDGHSFCCSGTGKHYGPKFTTGDVIGCCLNFRDGTAFYTKNGVHLGIAFRELKGALYPSIGLRTPGEKIKVNFGQKEFKFAIDHYMKEEKARLWSTINATPMPSISTSSPSSSEANLTATVHQLIMSYLVHHGFSETAKAFSKDAVVDDTNAMDVENDHQVSDEDVDMLNRQQIRNAVLKGDIDLAINLTNKLYPDVLNSNLDILFRLRCRKFIEMMGQCAGYHITSSDDEDDDDDDDDDVVKVVRDDTVETMLDDEIDNGELEVEVEEEKSGENVHEGDSNGVEEEDDDEDDAEEVDDDEEEFEDAMDVDDFAVSHSDDGSLEEGGNNHLVTSKNRKASKRRRGHKNSLNNLSEKFDAAMRFGRKLQDDYREDNREEIKKALEETFSLIAYPDPRDSVMAYLLDPSGREPVANILNSAILVSQGKPPIPPLEKVYRQASVTIKELLKNGVGAAAFVNVQKDCLA